MDFDDAAAAFGGRRVPIRAAGSKILRFMLESPMGCDGWLTPTRFVISFGWHPSNHHYNLDDAAAVIGQLLDWAGAVAGATCIRAVLPATTVPSIDGWLVWAFAPRRLWLDLLERRVTFHIRDADRGATPGPVDDFPAPPALEPPPAFTSLPEALACPHCRTPSTRYRVLRDGSWVCLACGRSFR